MISAANRKEAIEGGYAMGKNVLFARKKT